MKALQKIELLIVCGDLTTAREEVYADGLMSRVMGKSRELSDLQEKELLASIAEREHLSYIVKREINIRKAA